MRSRSLTLGLGMCGLLLFAISGVARANQTPQEQHWAAVTRWKLVYALTATGIEPGRWERARGINTATGTAILTEAFPYNSHRYFNAWSSTRKSVRQSTYHVVITRVNADGGDCTYTYDGGGQETGQVRVRMDFDNPGTDPAHRNTMTISFDPGSGIQVVKADHCGRDQLTSKVPMSRSWDVTIPLTGQSLRGSVKFPTQVWADSYRPTTGVLTYTLTPLP